MDQIKNYLRDVHRIENTGIYTEVSFYSPLEHMINRIAKVCDQKIVFVAGGTVSKDIRPDITILSSDLKCIGHIEAKTLDASIDYIENHDQIQKYLKVLPNVILTNFNEFFFYRDGKKYETVLLETDIDERGAEVVTNDAVLIKAMKRFLKYRMKRIQIFDYKRAFNEEYENDKNNNNADGAGEYTDEDLFFWDGSKQVIIDGKRVRVTESDYQQGYVIRKSRRMIRQITW